MLNIKPKPNFFSANATPPFVTIPIELEESSFHKYGKFQKHANVKIDECIKICSKCQSLILEDLSGDGSRMNCFIFSTFDRMLGVKLSKQPPLRYILFLAHDQ